MSWQPDVMIYHSPCDDGFGAAWAAWKRWGDTVEFVPGTYGKPAPDVTGKHVLIGDFSFKPDVLERMARQAKSIVLLDHHKTAEADLIAVDKTERSWIDVDQDLGLTEFKGGLPCVARFDMAKSGARLAWEFCHPGQPVPALVELIEDRDLWRFDLPETRAFSLWLRAHPYDFAQWAEIAELLADPASRERILYAARAIEGFYDQKIAELVRIARPAVINGYTVPVVNCPWAFASDVAHALLAEHPAAPFAACWYDRGDGSRSYSLRSEDSRADVSAIAKRYGGGGHRNAAGFEVPA